METIKKLSAEQIAILNNSSKAVKKSNSNGNSYNYVSIANNLDIICSTLKISIKEETKEFITKKTSEWVNDKTDTNIAVNKEAAKFKKVLRKQFRYYLLNKEVDAKAKELLKSVICD